VTEAEYPLPPILRDAGWRLASFRVRDANAVCDHCGVDTFGLQILKHDTFGVACGSACAVELHNIGVRAQKEKP